MKLIAIIPARLGSTRLPNKPLLKIYGKTMIRLTVEKVLESGVFPKIVVATDSALIQEECGNIEGVETILTSPKHTCGTERVLEAYQIVSAKEGNFDVVVNIQGDEPFLQPESLKELHQKLLEKQKVAEFWTTVSDLPQEEQEDENVAKVVVDLKGNALLFSRKPMDAAYKHTSIYAYTPQFLNQFCSLPPSPLEKTYRLEQLRALENGYPLNCIYLPYDSISINTLEDLEKAEITDFEIFHP